MRKVMTSALTVIAVWAGCSGGSSVDTSAPGSTTPSGTIQGSAK